MRENEKKGSIILPIIILLLAFTELFLSFSFLPRGSIGGYFSLLCYEGLHIAVLHFRGKFKLPLQCTSMTPGCGHELSHSMNGLCL